MSDLYKKEKVEDAINLLRENGYAVKKLTAGQLKDAEECERCNYEGECSSCRCSVCIIQ